ncbi:MAG TPA: hypothetical protein VMV29_06695 [Ktedonobacterales bacterium]|nr:hypothetical protein [Ktedonobacterales bacterium]
MATQDYVTARRAADLCGLNERTVRRHIASGKLQAERLADGDYAIPVSALATLRRVAKERAHRRGDLAGQLATLRAEVDALTARLDALTMPPTRTHAGHQDAATATPRPTASPVRMPLQRATTDRGVPGAPITHADAARWLVRHGIASETTPKSWPGWRETPPTPADVLALALSFADEGNWRKSWRLHPCGDSGCVCHDLLGGQVASE